MPKIVGSNPTTTTMKKKNKKPKIDLDEMERLETEDWANDVRRREYRKSPKWKIGFELLRKFKKKTAQD